MSNTQCILCESFNLKKHQVFEESVCIECHRIQRKPFMFVFNSDCPGKKPIIPGGFFTIDQDVFKSCVLSGTKDEKQPENISTNCNVTHFKNNLANKDAAFKCQKLEETVVKKPIDKTFGEKLMIVKNAPVNILDNTVDGKVCSISGT